MIAFVESSPFTRRLTKIAGTAADEVLWAIQSDLLKDPLRGDKVQRLGGIRKARTADPFRRKGKRGGFRYLYLYFVRDEQIALLYLFDKNEKEDLTKEDKRILASLAAEAEQAHGRAG